MSSEPVHKEADTRPGSTLLLLGEEIPPCTGGVAQWGYWMGLKLSESGYRVLYAARADYARSQEYYGDAFEVLPIEGSDWRHRKDRRILRLLRRAWSEHRPAAILCLNWKVARVPLLLRPFAGWKVVVAAHGMEITKKGGRLRRRVGLRWIFGSADLAVAVSRYTRDRVADFGVDPALIRVLPCGVDPARFRPRDGARLRRELRLEGLPVILTLARVVRRKGHDIVIRALSEVRRHVPNATYVIGGSGDPAYVDSLRALARERGVEEAVRFVGRVDEEALPGMYSASDVYVMASRSNEETGNYEGFGITYLEANACGVPVIGADSGGVSDAVVDGRSGFLIPPDDPAALADRLVRLLGDPPLARRMGEYGRLRVERELTWDRIAERFLDLLQERTGLCRPPRRRAPAAAPATA